MRTYSYLWLAPFLLFFFGYFLIGRFLSVEVISMPALLGLPLQDAVTLLSRDSLNVRILAEKEEADVAPGTILSQNPAPLQKIKPQQSVYLVIAKRARLDVAPDLVGLMESEARTRAEDLGLRLKMYCIESQYPCGHCIAQYPAAGSELPDKTMILYISASTTTTRVFPDLRGLAVADVGAFLDSYRMQLNVMPVHETVGDYSPGTIIDQKPLAGSLIDIKKPLTVHVSVQS